MNNKVFADTTSNVGTPNGMSGTEKPLKDENSIQKSDDKSINIKSSQANPEITAH